MLLDDESGSISGATTLHWALGGAVLVELAALERVTIEPASSIWRSALVHAAPPSPPPSSPPAAAATSGRSA